MLHSLFMVVSFLHNVPVPAFWKFIIFQFQGKVMSESFNDWTSTMSLNSSFLILKCEQHKWTYTILTYQDHNDNRRPAHSCSVHSVKSACGQGGLCWMEILQYSWFQRFNCWLVHRNPRELQFLHLKTAYAKAINFFDRGEFLSSLYTGTSAFISKGKDPSLMRSYQYDSRLTLTFHTVWLMSLRNVSPIHTFLTEEMNNDVMFHWTSNTSYRYALLSQSNRCYIPMPTVYQQHTCYITICVNNVTLLKQQSPG
jgi:hypothetical protein